MKETNALVGNATIKHQGRWQEDSKSIKMSSKNDFKKRWNGYQMLILCILPDKVQDYNDKNINEPNTCLKGF